MENCWGVKCPITREECKYCVKYKEYNIKDIEVKGSKFCLLASSYIDFMGECPRFTTKRNIHQEYEEERYSFGQRLEEGFELINANEKNL